MKHLASTLLIATATLAFTATPSFAQSYGSDTKRTTQSTVQKKANDAAQVKADQKLQDAMAQKERMEKELMMKEEAMKADSMKADAMKDKSYGSDTAKKADHMMKEDSMKADAMKADAMKDKSYGSDTAKKADHMMKEDSMKADHMMKDGMKKEGAMMKEPMMVKSGKPTNCPPGTDPQDNGTCMLR